MRVHHVQSVASDDAGGVYTLAVAGVAVTAVVVTVAVAVAVVPCITLAATVATRLIAEVQAKLGGFRLLLGSHPGVVDLCGGDGAAWSMRQAWGNKAYVESRVREKGSEARSHQ